MVTFRKGLAGAAALAWFALATQAAGECVRAPDMIVTENVGPAPGSATGTRVQVAEAAGPTRRDDNGRVIAPVIVNGEGPFPFIVDTGANRSVLSHQLAQRLGLTPSGQGDVHSIEGVQVAPMVSVSSLSYGGVSLHNSSLPLLGGGMMAGQLGVLGVDGMAGKRLRMDFDARCIEIVPSATARPLRGWAQIRGELRFGHLVVVPGQVAGVDTNVLIDTGSDVSLSNTAFRDALARQRSARSTGLTVERALTAGRPVLLDRAIITPALRLGNQVMITDVTFYVGDFHIFTLWGLNDEPTVLIGMDVLRQARAIAIDYQRGTVHIRIPARIRSVAVTR